MTAAAHQRPPAGTLVLDHLAHFVSDLGAAARALAQLGFVVTPPSAQSTPEGSLGTANVCVMLERGYLEFLAPTAATPAAQRLRATLQRYAGVHLACFGTPCAEDEHARLGWHEFDPLPLVHLQRRVSAEPDAATARFAVARVPPERMPEGRIQFVEHLTPEALWQPRWLAHANGVRALACVFVAAADPVRTAARWARFTALLPSTAGGYVHLAAERGHVLVGPREHWQALLGGCPEAPALAGYALECDDPDALARRCARAGLAPRPLRRGLFAVALPAALGSAWIFGTRAALALDQGAE